MAHGGAREGAGRKKGSKAEPLKRLESEIGTPLKQESLPKAIEVINEHLNSNDKNNQRIGVDMLSKILPYFMPKMQSVENKGETDHTIKVVYESEPIQTSSEADTDKEGS